MNKFIKYFLIFIIVDIVIIAGYIGIKSLSSKSSVSQKTDFEWVVIDEYYTPKNFIEGFIKNDAEARGLLPVSIRNYGKNEEYLKKFRGKNFAGPKKAQLDMMFKDMEDWMLIEMKYKHDKEHEIRRTNLYILIKEEWRLGDTGILVK
jgi:hypothetical protein